MKKIIYFLAFLLIVSCKSDGKKSSNFRVLPESSGKINHLSVVLSNDFWEGSVGETIRNVLAAPVDGLPQDEPLFTMNQIPPAVFSGFVTQNRTVLKIETTQEANVKILKDVYARPQRVVLVTGPTKEAIIEQIKGHEDDIIAAFKAEEIKEQQRRIKLSPNVNNTIKKKLGISITFPSAYRIAVDKDDFYWIRKDITTGHSNLMLYELPYGAIKKGDSLVGDILKLRDSIGRTHIPGRLDGTHMTTDDAYAPFIFDTSIDGKSSIETKGMWDVKKDFMAGPFINYIIDDKEHNRLLVAEGFVFAPSVEKRDYVFELESIIRSIKFDED
ncbi:DUF4837 family protein [Mangrovimonas sp. AS39]|uniref:DUF4837 family protein n=1 Tax=Mangrovimonas futianensis TaxID=2895523 RepID=UPI001E3587D7|nr:DUF4837 family protein [Mangrovimonas futianensis]MCF1190339.1 DUF4837 family protein [Mangrovimonas futianensis]MCF1193908.1 DUF4837 family protein [Mangrovimonas futianensis]MCF1420905.1 DUF4837 family protein [Mangrovimonas futianensis]